MLLPPNFIQHRAVESVVHTDGLRISIDTSAFPRKASFVYIGSDCRNSLLAGNATHAINCLDGASVDGIIVLPERPPFGWLSGVRTCLSLVPDRKTTSIEFISDADGEFGVELYCLNRKSSPTLILQNVYSLM